MSADRNGDNTESVLESFARLPGVGLRYDKGPHRRDRAYFESHDPLSPSYQPIARNARPSEIVDGNPILEPRSMLLESRAMAANVRGGLERRFFAELR